MASGESQSPRKLIEFMMLVGRLKATKRTGWVRRDVKDPESVASHMYRMAVMSFLADSDTGLSKDRCIKLALVHDLAECIVGDITPSDGISKEEKHRQELEYEDQRTNEAKFVKDLDRFDMILQAYEYETVDGRPKALQEFFDSTSGFFRHPKVQGWAKELYRMRDKNNDLTTE